MKCPNCHQTSSRVIDSRHTDEVSAIRRRRECENCGFRFTTFERMELSPLVVVKKDGNREVFSREKLMDGLLRACEKRPIPYEALEKTIARIESALRNLNKAEITSNEIGEFVMQELITLDQVAYVRFASVYKEFKDIDQLMDTLNHLAKGRDDDELQ
ncbi:transcriptional repressor NrdR [Salinicoccus sp. ID82-1]|uniref:transcriptional regulator NrdR n=1 Tax=Salinicoccus sp. ID82-1 TaxID=2820269 RepID=UPI001F005673|nr:transcriptional regulator NrdR [Salinicoccus sp. ID82-1]MCG1009297.1 transcriptional repressor NrdR [Salinicoccus sp. ID82-1]